MDGLFTQLAALSRASLARGGAAVGRYSVAALCGSLAAVAAMAAVGCSLLALWIAVLPHVGPALAALILAGVLAILCLGLLALASTVIRHGRKPRESNADHGKTPAGAAEMFAENKATLLLTALVAGFNAGAATENRSTDKAR